MAKKEFITKGSLIATLVRQRIAIFDAARTRSKDDRDLTEGEHVRVESLNSVIAHSRAKNIGDAKTQLAVAIEYAELHCHNIAREDETHALFAALHSVRAVFAGRS